MEDPLIYKSLMSGYKSDTKWHAPLMSLFAQERRFPQSTELYVVGSFETFLEKSDSFTVNVTAIDETVTLKVLPNVSFSVFLFFP